VVERTRIAWVGEGFHTTAHETDRGLALSTSQHAAVAGHGATVAIPLQLCTAKACQRQHDLRLLSQGDFLSVGTGSVSDIAILKQWLAQGNRYCMN
jgi:hypothetical protein